MVKLEQRIEDLAVGMTILAATSARAHRRPDLSRPMALELKPLAAFRDAAVRDGLQRLFDDDRFSICDFDALVELARVYPPAGLRGHLRPLHCVRWSEMDPEYREQIQAHIMAAFVPVEAEASDGGDGEVSP